MSKLVLPEVGLVFGVVGVVGAITGTFLTLTIELSKLLSAINLAIFDCPKLAAETLFFPPIGKLKVAIT